MSEPNREYLWILSPTPKVDTKAYEALLARVTVQGFDIRKLESTRQSD